MNENRHEVGSSKKKIPNNFFFPLLQERERSLASKSGQIHKKVVKKSKSNFFV